MCAKWLQSCSTLCNPIDCSPLDSSVHGIFQERILEWVAISFSKGSSRPRDQTHVCCIGRQILHHCTTREVPVLGTMTFIQEERSIQADDLCAGLRFAFYEDLCKPPYTCDSVIISILSCAGLVLSEEGNPAGLSSCSGGLRPLVELCVEPAGLCGRGKIGRAHV